MPMKIKPMFATIALLAIASTVFPYPMMAESGRADRTEVDREVELRQLAHQILFYNIELNTEQNEKLDALFHQVYVRVERLLSPHQLDRFHTRLKDGSGLKAALSEIQLSTVQEIQVRNLLQAVALQATPILTPAQRSQIEQNLQMQMDEESEASR
jgi:Spy/CpxP family protein refolding chaperone